MSTEKPKYIRKKCEHNKYSFQCKNVKGRVFARIHMYRSQEPTEQLTVEYLFYS